MPLKSSFIIVLILMPFLCLGQINYSASSIPANLKKGADAVIRNYSETITLEAQNKVVENVHVVVTILNEDGLYYGQHIVNYKSSTESVKVKDVILYDALGIKVKRLKKSDIKDIASFDNVSLISDERQKIISYTPVNYPATIEYSYTLQRKNSLHLCVFSPIPGFDVGVEKHELHFINNSSIAVEHKPYLLDEYGIKSLNNNKYIAEHISPIKKEAYAPNYWSVFPKVYFRPTKFNYEGHEGTF